MLTISNMFRGFLAGWAMLGMMAKAWAEVEVAATIAPVHSLVSMVTEGVMTPALIVRPGASPHGYAMKPSEARTLDHATIVFRVGANLETWMSKAIKTLASEARVVDLADVDGVIRLGQRKGGVWEGHDHHHDDDDQDDHGHDEPDDHGEAHDLVGDDPHLWLSPDNAITWLGAIATELAKLDPAQAGIYSANAERAAQRLTAITASIDQRLEPVKQTPYIVFHDAYQYFERRFELKSVGSVSLSDADRPSAKRLTEIRHRIEESGAVCAFAEPQFEPKLLETVIEGQDVAKGLLDPIGADLEPGVDLYPALIERLATSLIDCLS